MAKRFPGNVAPFIFVLLLAGCAASPGPQAVTSAGDPPIANGRGRLYVYRTTLSLGGDNSLLGNVARPVITIDGVRVAEGLPGGVFFCDLPPGRHGLAVTGVPGNIPDVTVLRGESVYVKLDWGLAGLLGQSPVSQVNAATGRHDTENRTRIAATCPD